MTCYLNSLLQALFMTPEFRNALYNWKFVPSSGIDESKSIPYQLQRLFLNLQVGFMEKKKQKNFALIVVIVRGYFSDVIYKVSRLYFIIPSFHSRVSNFFFSNESR